VTILARMEASARILALVKLANVGLVLIWGLIYTLPNFDRAWTSEFSVTGTNGMDYNDIAGRFADVLITRLKQDGMIP